ncbi:MAG: T9SS type A sorting domain-containing protein [Flavobacteriales bacterium]|nr:T9SS type A sorting domain-containing protein [Flavobacteriales bacterium]
MKTIKKVIIILPVAFALVLFIRINNGSVHSNQNAGPTGRTGAPGESTCAGCHNQFTVIDTMGWITSDIPSSGYIAGQTYTINATVAQTGVNTFGFSMTNQDGSGAFKGTFVASANTQINGGGAYMTHTGSSTAGNDSKTWTFDWIAPSSGTGNLTFYASMNAADGFSNTTGDQIYTSSLAVTEDPASSVQDLNELVSVEIGPNPFETQININSELIIKEYEMFDQLGKQVLYNKVQSQNAGINTSQLIPGVFFLKITFQNDQSQLFRMLRL